MTKVELERRVAELEREVATLNRYIAALHESHDLGPIIIVPESFDRSLLANVQIIC